MDISYHIISLHKQSTNFQAKSHYNLHQSTGVSVFTSNVSFDVFSRLRWASFPSASSENNLFQREIRAFLFNLPYLKEVVAMMRKTPSQVWRWQKVKEMLRLTATLLFCLLCLVRSSGVRSYAVSWWCSVRNWTHSYLVESAAKQFIDLITEYKQFLDLVKPATKQFIDFIIPESKQFLDFVMPATKHLLMFIILESKQFLDFAVSKIRSFF